MIRKFKINEEVEINTNPDSYLVKLKVNGSCAYLDKEETNKLIKALKIAKKEI